MEFILLSIVVIVVCIHFYMEHKKEKRLEARPIKRTVKHYLKYGER